MAFFTSFENVAALPTEWREDLTRYESDRRSGASRLAAAAVDLVARWSAAVAQDVDLIQRQTALIDLCRALQSAQPSMAPVLAALNEALNRCEAAGDVWRWLDAIAQWSRQWPEASVLRAEATVAAARALIPPASRLLTLSRSSLVEQTLLSAEPGAIHSVTCCESRPLYEGRAMAAALASAGLHVSLIIDAAVASAMQEIDVALVGADAVHPGGVVNKVGTSAVALAALQSGVPCYALAPSERWLHESAAALLSFANHPGEEVWQAAPPGVEIRNRYFEATPLSWFHGLVSEQGVGDAGRLPTSDDLLLHRAWS